MNSYDTGIFINIPKTGSKTVRLLTQDKAWCNTAGIAHKTLDEVRDVIGDRAVRDCPFKFTFVRNPWDRLLSFYSYYTQIVVKDDHVAPDFIKERARLFLGFKDFNEWALQFEIWSPKDTQCYFVTDEIDFIGRYESFEYDLKKICSRLDLPFQALDRYNRTKHDNYTKVYSEEARKHVAEVFAEDIERFGYKFGY